MVFRVGFASKVVLLLAVVIFTFIIVVSGGYNVPPTRRMIFSMSRRNRQTAFAFATATTCTNRVTTSRKMRMTMTMTTTSQKNFHDATIHTIRIPSDIWREAAFQHQERIYQLLQPGFATAASATTRTGPYDKKKTNTYTSNDDSPTLDPKHPIYNFLIEYYGLKGMKGPKRLARWSPSPGLVTSLLFNRPHHDGNTVTIDSMEEFQHASYGYAYDKMYHRHHQEQLASEKVSSAPTISNMDVGVVLEGVRPTEDFEHLLHLRGATILDGKKGDVLYSPSLYFGRNDPSRRDDQIRLVSPFLWYQSLLKSTLQAEPMVYCHGLHEWAMQYQPDGAPPPPSAKYQAHMPLRVSQAVINRTVERRGVHCTHVDALRFFAPAAAPLSHFGMFEGRQHQMRLEQPACVHANMDLLRMALKVRPFCDPILVQRILELALRARRLDVAASPYDASAYGIAPIPVETYEGRAHYRLEQIAIMNQANDIRRDLLALYELVLSMAFDESLLEVVPKSTHKKDPAGGS